MAYSLQIPLGGITLPFSITILILLYVTYLISLLFFFHSMSRIFHILKTRHKSAYRKLGYPSAWKPLLKRRTFSFISSKHYPKDKELGSFTTLFKVSRAFLFVSMILMIALTYSLYAGLV